MSPAYWCFVQLGLYVAYIFPVGITLTFVGMRRGWPNWLRDCLLEVVQVPFWILMAFASIVIVDEHDLAVLYFILDGLLVLDAAWRAWRIYDRNRKGKWAPSLLGKVVVNLGHRLALGDA